MNIVQMNLLGSWFAVILPYIAGNQIATIFLFRTFMSQQPADIYEAAEIDGSGDIRTYFSLCLPMTFGIIMVQGVAIFSAIYNDYLWPLMIFMNNPEHGTLMPALKDLAVKASEAILSDGTMAGQGRNVRAVPGQRYPSCHHHVIGLKFFVDGEFASGLKL